ncbi:DUF7331 family protein [Halosimplex sp. J119]
MQDSDSPSAAALREQISAVSERFIAVEVDGETVVFDTTEPDSWILTDNAVDPERMR